MKQYRIPSMSEKQAKFIQSLIDQYGYKDSPHRENYLLAIDFVRADIEHASWLIEFLLKENKKRTFPKRKAFKENEIPIVQDLSQYIFCPASYAIKRSYLIEKDEELNKVDENEIPESYLLERIKILKLPVEKIKEEAKEYFMQQYSKQFNDFKQFIESDLVYNGYSKTENPFMHNDLYNINGRPHLIFQNSKGQRTLVVEKFSHKKTIPNIVWPNNLIQALSYLFLFEEIKCDKAVIVYWRYTNDGSWTLDRQYKIFHVDKTNFNRESLIKELTAFIQFLKNKNISFDSASINLKKCFKCSCCTLCNHKSGLIDNLLLPLTCP